MSVTRTFTVTVSDPGSGNKYFIDGVQQATINIAEGGTYRFNYPSGHPFKFSTTSDGTHNSGSEYTTGVTHNSSTQVTIVVASGAPTLYYYCSLHSGMGGQANTPASNTYGVFAWDDGEWGAQGDNTASLTGVSATTSVGDPVVGAEQGWGRDAWGTEPWGESFSPVVALTGFGLTSAVGQLPYAQSEEGWGRDEWGNGGWGVDPSVIVGLTGDTPPALTASLGALDAFPLVEVPITAPSNQGTTSVGAVTTTQLSIAALTAPSQMTSQLGSFDNAGTLVGWGRNGWGEEPYGDSFNKLVQPAGLSATTSVGSLLPADVVGLTGVSATASVGAISPADVVGLTGVSATASVGGLSAGIGVLVTAPSAATASVGSILPADVVGITAPSAATTGVGSLEVTEAQIVQPTAPSAATSGVGSIIIGIGVPLTAPSAATSSVGSITPEDVMGLTGLEVTAELGTTGFGTIGYKDIDITGITSYTDVNHAA